MSRHGMSYHPHPDAAAPGSTPAHDSTHQHPDSYPPAFTQPTDFRQPNPVPLRQNPPFTYANGPITDRRPLHQNEPYCIAPSLTQNHPTFSDHRPDYANRQFAQAAYAAFSPLPSSPRKKLKSSATYSEPAFPPNPRPVSAYSDGAAHKAAADQQQHHEQQAQEAQSDPKAPGARHTYTSLADEHSSDPPAGSKPAEVTDSQISSPTVPSADADAPLVKSKGAKRKRSRAKKSTPAVSDGSELAGAHAPAPEPEKTVYSVIVADVSPVPAKETSADFSEEIELHTAYVAGTYSTKAAANGAAWAATLQGHPKSDFKCHHTQHDGCSRIELVGLSALQEEPQSESLTTCRTKSRLIAQVTPVSIPNVPLNVTTKEDAVYIVSLTSDDGVPKLQPAPNTEIIGVYHNYSMARWHAHSTLNKYYGPSGSRALAVDRTLKGKDVVLRFEVCEGPMIKVIEVSKKRVGGPMSNTWTAATGQVLPNIHGSPAAPELQTSVQKQPRQGRPSLPKQEEAQNPKKKQDLPTQEQSLADLLRSASEYSECPRYWDNP